MAAQFQYDVFISYNQKDRESAAALEEALKQRGIKVWRDDRLTDSASSSLIATINIALERSAKVVVLWSRKSLASQWVQGEAERARMAGRVVPVSLEPVSALLPFIPAPFNILPTIDVSAETFDLEVLLRALGAEPVAGAAKGIVSLTRADVDLTRLPDTYATRLYGRDAEMAALIAAWDGGATRIFAFDAIGGAGKTALAYHFVQALKASGWRGAKRVYAWSFYSQGSDEDRQTSADEFFKEAIRFFSGHMEDAPRDPREKGEVLARLIQANRALLILDGLEPLQYATGRAGRADSSAPGGLKDPGMKALLAALAEDNPGLCLVTTRIPLAELAGAHGVQFEPLDRLPLMEAIALIRDLGVEPALTPKLYKLPALSAFAEMTPPWQPPRAFHVAEGDDRAPMPTRDAKALIEAVEELDGHVLALTLVAKFLGEHHNGSARAIAELPSLADLAPNAPHRNPYRVMRAIEIALARRIEEQGKTEAPADVIGGRELALLLFLGFFDRPASTELLPVVFPEKGALKPDADDLMVAATEYERVADEKTLPERDRRKRETVREARRRILFRRLFASIHAISPAELRAALSDLAARGLVSKIDDDAAWEETAIDCHPLVREYFSTRLKELDLAAYQAGHVRLYDHFRYKGLPEAFRDPVAYGVLALAVSVPDANVKAAVLKLAEGKVSKDALASWPPSVAHATGSQLRAAAKLIDGPDWERALAAFQPDDERGMAPLFHSIGHGCEAGRPGETWREVHFPRIWRGNKHYAVVKLGLNDQDLAALACYFEQPFSRPMTILAPIDRTMALSSAGYALRTIGRMSDAVAPYRAALAGRQQEEDWTDAANVSENVGHVLLMLGLITGEDGAVSAAQSAVAFADRSEDGLRRMSSRANLAAGFLALGELGQSETMFRDSEVIQQALEPAMPQLYSTGGFRLCGLLGSRGRWHEAAERAAYAFAIAKRFDWLLDIGLDQLTQVRAAMATAPHNLSIGIVEKSAVALAALRRANDETFLPPALLTHAESLWRFGDLAGAETHLRECDVICKRGPMPLFAADSALLKARLQVMADRPARATKYRNEAASLIDKHAYGRGAVELAVLDAEIAHAESAPDLLTRLGAAATAIQGTPYHDERTGRTIDGGWWGLLPRLNVVLPAGHPARAKLYAARDAYNAERDAYLALQDAGGVPSGATSAAKDSGAEYPEVSDALLDEVLADAELRSQLNAMLADADIAEPLDSLPRETQRAAVSALLAAMGDTPEPAPPTAASSGPSAPVITDAVVRYVFADPQAQDILLEVMRDADLDGRPSDLPFETQREIVELLVEQGVIEVGSAKPASPAPAPPTAAPPAPEVVTAAPQPSASIELFPGAPAGAKPAPSAKAGWAWWPFARKR